MPTAFFSESSNLLKPNMQLLPGMFSRTNPPFYFTVNDFKWSWSVQDKEYYPALGRLVLSGGVGGVQTDNSGRITSLAFAVQNVAKRGDRVLEPKDPRVMKVAPKGYLEEYPTQRGKCYMPYWVTGYKILNRRVVWLKDDDLRRKFLRELVRSNVVQSMDPDLKRVNLEYAQTELRDAQRSAYKNPTPQREATISRMEEMIEDLQADLDKPRGLRRKSKVQ